MINRTGSSADKLHFTIESETSSDDWQYPAIWGITEPSDEHLTLHIDPVIGVSFGFHLSLEQALELAQVLTESVQMVQKAKKAKVTL